MVNIYNKLLEGVVAMFGGVYCPTIISYGGIPRGDSKFTLNGACKFMFPCPKDVATAQTMIDTLKELASKLDRAAHMVQRPVCQSGSVGLFRPGSAG